MQRPGSVTAIAIVEIVLSIIGLVMTVIAIMAIGAITGMAEDMGSVLAEAAEAAEAAGGDAGMMDAFGAASATATWMLYLGLAISLISLVGGIMMLKGASWTPFVAIGTWAIKIVIGLLGGFSIWLLIPILFTVIWAYLLFQPDAKAYFSGSAG